MSTRCSIIISDGENEAILYHHTDGFPEGAVGKVLNEFVEPRMVPFYNMSPIVNLLIKMGERDDVIEDYVYPFDFQWAEEVAGDVDWIFGLAVRIDDPRSVTLVHEYIDRKISGWGEESDVLVDAAEKLVRQRIRDALAAPHPLSNLTFPSWLTEKVDAT